jgi:hypothetical protein
MRKDITNYGADITNYENRDLLTSLIVIEITPSKSQQLTAFFSQLVNPNSHSS